MFARIEQRMCGILLVPYWAILFARCDNVLISRLRQEFYADDVGAERFVTTIAAESRVERGNLWSQLHN